MPSKKHRSTRLATKNDTASNRTRRGKFRQLLAETLERRMLLTAITTLEPPAESHDAPVSTDVSATFDENISAGTATLQTFVAHTSQRGRLLGGAGSVSTDGATVTLDPTSDFFPGEVVRVTATSAIRSTSASPADKQVWNFRAGVTLGSGSFADSGQTSLGSTYKNRLGDLDGDGDLDAFVLDGNGSSRVMTNDGGVFSTSQMLGNFNSYDARLGDLDGDGDLDAFVISEIYTSNRVLLNDGTGQFSAGQLLADHASLSVDLGDLDGDGDLDAYVGNRENNRVLLNNGSGNFTDTNQNIDRDPSRKVKIGDVDGDGDLDLLSGNPDNPDRIFLNNGSATFTDSGQQLGAYASRAVDFGDVDGDGDMDLVMAHRDSGNQVLLNDGNGIFTDGGQRLGDHDTWGLALGDLDADGDLDIMAGNEGEASRVWLNDGSGIFSDSGQDIGNATTRVIEFGDLDGDGDLDAFIGNLNGSRIWLNENLTPSVTLGVDTETILESGAVATFTATLSAAATEPVTIDLEFTGTADTTDYTASATQIAIPIGETSGSITVTAVDDTLDEPDETVVVDIVSASGASESGVQQQTTTITDDDEPAVPEVTLSLDNSSISEAAGVATFSVTLSELTSLPVTVDLAFTGTASAADYAASATQVVIAAGETTASVTVTAVQDEESEQDETVVVEIIAVNGGVEAGTQQQTTTIVDDDLPPSFAVTTLEATDSGFRIEFSSALDGSSLNLFDTQNAALGAADVVVTGDSSGPIAGSLVIEDSAVTFVKTGDPLAADTYTVTLRSGGDGFKDTDARLLDGDGDGTAGDNYVGNFTVTAAQPDARTIGIPDFVRGPGQDVNLPADSTTGIPITISDGENVRAADVRIAYDPARLEITGATAPAGGSVILNTTTTPGVAILVFFSSTSLPAGSSAFITLQATAPTQDASEQYGEQQVLDVHAVTIGDGNDNEFPVIVDDALHFSSYFADVSGNGRINASDAAQVARFAALIDNGFSSSLNTDPIVVGDISGNGRINAADASRVAQFAALIDVPEIPAVPGGIQITGSPNPDPLGVPAWLAPPSGLGGLRVNEPLTVTLQGGPVEDAVESGTAGFRVEQNFTSQADGTAIMSDRAIDLVIAQEEGASDLDDDLLLAISMS